MLGRILLTIDCIGLLFGAPVADYNHTHIFNPRWPPHAKFHTGQTITLSVLLGLATVFLTWRPYLQRGTSRELARQSLYAAAFTGSIYWLAALAAIYFPGTDGLDPEFGGPGFPQRKLFLSFMSLGLAGVAIETL